MHLVHLVEFPPKRYAHISNLQLAVPSGRDYRPRQLLDKVRQKFIRLVDRSNPAVRDFATLRRYITPRFLLRFIRLYLQPPGLFPARPVPCYRREDIRNQCGTLSECVGVSGRCLRQRHGHGHGHGRELDHLSSRRQGCVGRGSSPPGSGDLDAPLVHTRQSPVFHQDAAAGRVATSEWLKVGQIQGLRERFMLFTKVLPLPRPQGGYLDQPRPDVFCAICRVEFLRAQHEEARDVQMRSLLSPELQLLFNGELLHRPLAILHLNVGQSDPWGIRDDAIHLAFGQQVWPGEVHGVPCPHRVTLMVDDFLKLRMGRRKLSVVGCRHDGPPALPR